MQKVSLAVKAVAVLLIIALHPVAAQYGSSYLGCFSFSRLLYLKGVEGAKAAKHTQPTIGTCFKDCRDKGYSLSIVAADFRCWCAMATPPPMAMVDDSACQPGSGKGALVFYHYEGAHACRVQELDTIPSSFPVGPQGQSAAVFDSLAQTLALHPSSDGPQRVVAKFPAQLYGQFEVSARVSVHPSTITSIDIVEAGTSSAEAKAPSTEDITWQFTNTSANGIGKNILLGVASRSRSAASALDYLMKPTQYKTLGGLRQEENLGNTWVTYTIDWQSDKVTWALNGVPLRTQWSTNTARANQQGMLPQSSGTPGGKRSLLSLAPQGTVQQQQQKRWQQRKHAKAAAQQQAQQPDPQQQRQQAWAPPNKPAQLSFGVRLNPKGGVVEGQQQQPASHSLFMEVRRIVCDKPRVRGDKGPVVPTWFLLGQGWDLPQLQQRPLKAKKQQQQPKQQKQEPKQQKQEQQVLGKVQASKDDTWQQQGGSSRASGLKTHAHSSPHKKPAKVQRVDIKDCPHCQSGPRQRSSTQRYRTAVQGSGQSSGMLHRDTAQKRHQAGYTAGAWEHEQRRPAKATSQREDKAHRPDREREPRAPHPDRLDEDAASAQQLTQTEAVRAHPARAQGEGDKRPAQQQAAPKPGPASQHAAVSDWNKSWEDDREQRAILNPTRLFATSSRSSSSGGGGSGGSSGSSGGGSSSSSSEAEEADAASQQRLEQAYLAWHDKAPAAGYRAAEPKELLEVEPGDAKPLWAEDEPEWPKDEGAA